MWLVLHLVRHINSLFKHKRLQFLYLSLFFLLAIVSHLSLHPHDHRQPKNVPHTNPSLFMSTISWTCSPCHYYFKVLSSNTMPLCYGMHIDCVVLAEYWLYPHPNIRPRDCCFSWSTQPPSCSTHIHIFYYIFIHFLPASITRTILLFFLCH